MSTFSIKNHFLSAKVMSKARAGLNFGAVISIFIFIFALYKCMGAVWYGRRSCHDTGGLKLFTTY